MVTMSDGRAILFMVFVFCLADIIAPGRGSYRHINILVRAACQPGLAEVVVRLLLWDLAYLRGAEVRIHLVGDTSCKEISLLLAMLREEGFLGLEMSCEPDLVFDL